MNETLNGYDLIGDIHGYASKLKQLLALLGYEERDGCYRHPERKVIFVGDFIDRGPEIMETLRVVRTMVEQGSALAVMGNHEYNAICYHTRDANGEFLRPHTERKTAPHRATLEQIAEPFPEIWADYLKWFQTLPLFLDLGKMRVVHACWDGASIEALNGAQPLNPEILLRSASHGTPEYEAVEVLLKRREIPLPEGAFFSDKEGTVRTDIRVKWWTSAEGRTYHEMSLPESETVPRTLVPGHIVKTLGAGYQASETPVFVGHYWLPPAAPRQLTSNVVCLDYSVAKGGPLVAYRWEGEALPKDGSFVSA